MDEFNQGIESAKSKFDSFSSNTQNVCEKVSKVGGTLTKGLSIPLVGLGTAIIKTGVNYESGMSKVQAISGSTAEEMSMLGEEALRMAGQTKFSTAEAAEAYQYMAMAGWKAGDMVDGLSGIMNLAAASGENLGTTSDIVTDALTAFGLKASDSGRFADVLAAASNNANTNVSMLGESFKYVAPVAGALGYSVEDTSVALGLMANSGIKASQAGTSLRTAMTNLASPTSSMVKVMDEYGISLTDANGTMLPFSEVMGVLRERMGGLDEATQASAASTLFGREAMSGMLAIINAAPEDFNKLTEAINNSVGTTQEMASIMQDNASGAVDRLKSAVDVLFTNLSQFLIPAFTSVVEKVTEVVQWFGSLDDGTKQLILTIAGIAIAVGPILTVIGNVIKAVSTIGSAITGLISVVQGISGAVSGLFAILAANPIALVIAAVAALVAGLVVLWNTNEGFRDAVKGIWDAIVGFFQAAAELIVSAFEGVAAFFVGVWETIQSAFSGVVEFFQGLFQSAAELVQSAWSAVVDFFVGVWEGIQSVFSSVAEVLGAVFAAAAEAVQSAWNAVVEFFSGVWNGIQGVFSAVSEVLGGVFHAAWETVQSAWNAATEFFSGIAEGIRGAFETVTEFLGSAFQAAWETVESAWNTAKEFFSDLWNGIKEAASVAAEKIGSAFEQGWKAVKSAWNTAGDFFNGIWQTITGVFSDALSYFKNIGKNIMDGLINGIKEKVTAVKNAVGNVVNTVKNVFTGKKGFDEHSPSKWANQVFRYVMDGGVDGLHAGSSNLLREVNSIAGKVKSGLDFGTATVGLTANGTVSGGSSLYGQNAASASNSVYNFNFNSPRELDPLSAVKKAKKAAQQMAMGYV